MSIFYVGQQVGCLIFGEGVVILIESGPTFPIRVKFQNTSAGYTSDGRYNIIDTRPTLYPLEQYKAIIATLPAPEPEKWQPKKGEWCWFWDEGDDDNDALLSQFRGMDGAEFKSNSGTTWNFCAPFTGELPEHLKEVQP